MERETRTARTATAGAKAPARRPRARKAADGRTVGQRLTDALAQQAATAEILRVMAASPADADPVMEAVARNAALLCRAQFARVLLRDGDVMRTLAHYSADDGITMPAHVVPLRRTTVTGRAVLERATIHHADIIPLLDAEYPDAREPAKDTKFRAVLAVPLLRQGEAYGAIFVWRRKPGLFALDQVDLVEMFANQAAVAIENVRLFHEARTRNRELAESLRQQTATNEVLRVISRSTFDLDTVLQTLVASAARLCDADKGTITREKDGRLYRVAAHGFSREFLEYIRDVPVEPDRGTAVGRALLEGKVVHIPDVRADPDYTFAEALRLGDFRSILSVPMVRDGTVIGALALTRTDVRPFTDKQIELVSAFADQAVIAIENVRLFSELGARNCDLTIALEQQTATSEILRVISQSQTDTQPVFETIVQSVRALCGAAFSGVYLLEGQMLRLVASEGMSPDELAAFKACYPRRIGPDTVSGRAALECRVVQAPDLLADPLYSEAPGVRVRARTVLGVPLLRDGRAIGSIGVWRSEVRLFSETQITLLQTFADQAVIAIENVRLFKELEARNDELTNALEQQTATSEILRVISRSQSDAQPVFDTIVAAAQKLCGAVSANVFTFDGKLAHLVAMVNVNPDYGDLLRPSFPRPLDRTYAATRSILTRDIVTIPDVLTDPEYGNAQQSLVGGFRSVLAVPLMRRSEAIGCVVVGRLQAGPFPTTQIELLKSFADQAVIAIENVRLFSELQSRTAALTRSVGKLHALGEVGQAVSSSLDLETVLSTIVARATKLTGMDGGSIYEYDESRGEFFLQAADRLSDELVVALRATAIRKGEGALGRLAIAGEPVQIPDIADATVYQSSVREILLRLGHRSLLAVPLKRDSVLLGGLVVNRTSPGAFDAEVIELLEAFATQSALAIQNARLYREIETKSRQLETASRHKSEFLANMSHELRTPLNAIIGFSDVLAERLFGELNDKQAEYVGDISESGRHLLSLINDILDLSKIEAGRMELDPSEFEVAAVIDNTLALVRERAQRRAIELRSAVDPRLTRIRADERKVKQVLLNLLSNALKFTPEGGSIDVRATAYDDRAEISVTDTGVGIAAEDQEAVFEEFRQVGAAVKKVEGTGLGLAISRKFIELHGGRIWVASEPGKGSTFTFTLPRR